MNNQTIREQLLEINRQSASRLGIHIAAGTCEGLWKQIDLEKSARCLHILLIAEMFKAAHTLVIRLDSITLHKVEIRDNFQFPFWN